MKVREENWYCNTGELPRCSECHGVLEYFCTTCKTHHCTVCDYNEYPELDGYRQCCPDSDIIAIGEDWDEHGLHGETR